MAEPARPVPEPAGRVAEPAGPARPRVVAAAVVPRRHGPVIAFLGEVVAGGGSALMVTADGARPSGLAAGVESIDLVATERRLGLHPLIARSPWRVARRLAGRPKKGPTWAWSAWSRSKPYRAARPWMLWRALRRHLDAVDPEHVDHLILVGIESWPVAWHLTRRNPAITVGWDVPAEVWQRVGRAAPERAPVD